VRQHDLAHTPRSARRAALYCSCADGQGNLLDQLQREPRAEPLLIDIPWVRGLIPSFCSLRPQES
jgi:hypothetical protein